MTTPTKTPHTKPATADLEAAKLAHASGQPVQFIGKAGGQPYEWTQYGAPFTWHEAFWYRPEPKQPNLLWKIMPEDYGTETRENCTQPLYIVDALGETVVVITKCGHAQATSRNIDIAKAILLAVNNHEKLVEALKECVEAFERPSYPDDKAYNLARSVLASISDGQEKQ